MLGFVVLATLLGGSVSLTVFDRPGITVEQQFETENGPVTLIVGAKKGRSVNFKFPEPVEVKSSLSVIGDDSRREINSGRRGRKIQKIEIDSEGIPVIDGVRSPDDPTDTRVFRNARVINNVLVTNEEEAQEQLAILDQKNKIDSAARIFKREGRILSGFDAAKAVETVSDYTAQGYQPSRAGLIEPDYLEQGLNKKGTNEKVVGYSYTTGGGGIQKHTSKNVIYGSGFAAIPPYNPQAAPTKDSKKVEQAPNESFNTNFQQSRRFSTGFTPMLDAQPFPKPPPLISSNNQHSSSNFQHRTQQQSSSPKVVFPDSSETSKPSISTSQGTPSVSVAPLQNHANTFRRSQVQYAPQPTQQEGSWSRPQNSFHRPQVNRRENLESSNTYYHNGATHNAPSRWSVAQQPVRRLHQDSIQDHSSINHLNRFQSQHKPQVPTPHQAFGQAHSSHLIHSNIVPADPSEFVVEHQNFQSHPDAPVFSVPVPRPIQSQGHVRQRQHPQHPQQPQQQHHGNFHHQSLNTYVHPNGQYVYEYPGFETVEDRPIFDRMMDPLRRMGDRFRNALNPMFNAGQRLGTRFRIGERLDKIASGTVDTDAIPIVAGAGAVAALGALGAYAATKFADGQLSLPLAIGRKTSDAPATNDVLLQLAEELESEEPAFIKRFTSAAPSSSWLQNNCAKRIFCNLVTSAMDEEVEKMPAATSGRSAADIFKGDITYLEKHLNILLDKVNPDIRKRRSLKEAARGVLESVRERTCTNFSCHRASSSTPEETASDVAKRI